MKNAYKFNLKNFNKGLLWGIACATINLHLICIKSYNSHVFTGLYYLLSYSVKACEFLFTSLLSNKLLEVFTHESRYS